MLKLNSPFLKIFIPSFCAFLIGNSNFLHAQLNTTRNHKIDSIHQKFVSDSTHLFRKRKVIHYLNVDFKNAYVSKNFVSLIGLRAGITYSDIHNHTFGIGFYTLNEFSIFKSNVIKSYHFEAIDYFVLFYEYQIYNGKVFDVLFPFELGFGHYSAYSTETPAVSVLSSYMVPTGAGVKCIFMPHAWIGIKFESGYRYVWEETAQISLDGLYFSVGIRLDVNHMIKDLRFLHMKRKYHHNVRLATNS